MRADLQITTLVTGRWRENCYIVSDPASKAALLVDPGEDAPRILRVLGELGVRVGRILLTHGHYDHVGAAAALSHELGLPCELHPADLSLVRRAPLYAMAFERRRLAAPDHLKPLCEDEVVELGAATFRVVPAPGHTPGSVCFLTEGILISGDVLLEDAVGRTDLPGGDAEALHRSVDSLIARVDDAVTLLPGHGSPWSMHAARAWWQRRQVGGREDMG